MVDRKGIERLPVAARGLPRVDPTAFGADPSFRCSSERNVHFVLVIFYFFPRNISIFLKKEFKKSQQYNYNMAGENYVLERAAMI